jgi:hypothetical protein
MVSILSLWAPILVAAVLVFVASSIMHMLLKYHQNDFQKVPDEDGVMDALRPFGLTPGDYLFPFAGGTDAMKSEEFLAKVDKGPIASVTIFPKDAWTNMTGVLVQWFLYSLVVAVVAAYLSGRMLGPGAEYLSVFRVTGTVAFCCYAMSLPQASIWFKKNWATTGRAMFDGLIYSLLTAGAFGWLWP